MSLKRKIRKIYSRLLFGYKSDSETYIKRLRNLGMRIGQGSVIYDPLSTVIDETRPFMIDIGNNVKITSGVTILTHGYDWSVLKGKYGTVLGSCGGVHIGDNVFIGMNTTILKGVHIGNNVIIGATSLVNKNIPDNVVVAGNPIRIITDVDTYHKKRQDAQIDEAIELVKEYREVFGTDPDERILSEFFWLFVGKDDDYKDLPECWKEKMRLVGNEDESIEVLKSNHKIFDNMESFLKGIPWRK